MPLRATVRVRPQARIAPGDRLPPESCSGWLPLPPAQAVAHDDVEVQHELHVELHEDDDEEEQVDPNAISE